MKKMVLPAEGHHTGKVGQSDQLTPHLHVHYDCDKALGIYTAQNFTNDKFNLLGLALSGKEGS